MGDLYEPVLMRIEQITDETATIRTLRLRFVEEEVGRGFSFRSGQFGMFSVFGVGECPLCLSGPATRPDYVECSFQKMGKVTSALRELNEGDLVGFRGPYGNGFPIEELRGGDIVFIGMGIGMAPVRSLIWTCLDRRDDFGRITIIYGARGVAEMAFKGDVEQWEQRPDVELVKTVDPGGETPEWTGRVGFVPTVLGQVRPSARGAYAVVCGPPVGIKFTLPVLAELGFPPERVVTTLENRMKCGLGKCGRCNVGPYFVCKDGPVFTAAQLARLPADY